MGNLRTEGTETIAQTDPRDWYLVIGPSCWGRDQSRAKAIRNCEENLATYHDGGIGLVFKVTADTRSAEWGGIEHPEAWPPIPDGQLNLKARF